MPANGGSVGLGCEPCPETSLTFPLAGIRLLSTEII